MALGLELAKPFSIASAFTQFRQFRVFTAAAITLVGLLAVAYSLQSELTFMSLTRGDLAAERSGERDAAQRAAERYERLQTELSALKPASSKERDMDAYLARRSALSADLRQAEQDRRQAPAVASPDPGATALATYAQALGVRVDAQTLGLFLPLVGVLALELGAAFSVVLVEVLPAQGWRTWRTAVPRAIPWRTVKPLRLAHMNVRHVRARHVAHRNAPPGPSSAGTTTTIRAAVSGSAACQGCSTWCRALGARSWRCRSGSSLARSASVAGRLRERCATRPRRALSFLILADQAPGWR